MTLFKMEWQNNRKSVVSWIVVLSVVMILMMSLFPTMKETGLEELVTDKLDALPDALLKAFNLTSGPGLTDPTGYFAYVFQYLFIASSIFACMLGSKALIKEELDGTIEFLYAQPISRYQIVKNKWFASMSMLVIFWSCLYIVGLGITVVVNQGVSTNAIIFEALSKIYLTEFFVLIFLTNFGFLLSSLLKTLNLGLSMGLVFGLYLIGIMGDLQENLSWLKKISPIAMANPATVLSNDSQYIFILILSVLSICLIIATTWIYSRKDLDI